MKKKTLTEGAYFQADNGEWFALTGAGAPEGAAAQPRFEKLATVDLKALSISERSGRFSCMDGVYEVGGASSSDRTGRFSCMDGIYEVGGAGTSDRTGRFGCMDGICEV